MNPVLPDEAADFGRSAGRALAGLGGTEAARRAEGDPTERSRRVSAVLEDLGVGEIDPRSDLESAAGAAELCRAAGRVALPYPVVGVLLRRRAGADAGLPFGLVAGGPTGRGGGGGGGGDSRDPRTVGRLDHGDLFPLWRVATVSGRAGPVAPSGRPLGTKLGPFVTDMEAAGSGGLEGTADGLSDADESDAEDARFHLSLTAWLLLGAVERALELAVDHVTTRVQFGQALSGFQAVQFQLADAAVGVEGLREICHFTLWRLFHDPAGSLPDALALRLHALDSARSVLRTAQQLHGAAGLCDEYDISILYRHLQPALRLPFGAERSAQELFDAVARDSFDSLFPQGGRPGR